LQTFLLRSPNLKASVPETECLSRPKYGLTGLSFDRLVTGFEAETAGFEQVPEAGA
jgi:hypothetical protein